MGAIRGATVARGFSAFLDEGFDVVVKRSVSTWGVIKHVCDCESGHQKDRAGDRWGWGLA
jgi:hypothetical protein